MVAILTTPRPEPSDRELVDAILAGPSDTAFRLLYARHIGRIYRFAFRMVGSELDAQDVVQEMWLRAIPRLGAFEWRSSLSTWLIAIAANIARGTLEQRGRWRGPELAEDVPATSDPTTDIDIERAVARLPVGSRTAFLLHDVEGFTHEEIAAQLGWTAGTSKSQLFRARRALRRMLGQSAIEETGT